VEYCNVVEVRAQRQLEDLAGGNPARQAVQVLVMMVSTDLYLICMVRWSRMSMELVEMTKRIGTNWKISVRATAKYLVRSGDVSWIVNIAQHARGGSKGG
jgi:hypothetical protein